MGLYAVDCSVCKKAFQWFSGGNPAQVCESCQKSAKPSVMEIAEGWKNFKPAVPLSFTLARIKATRNR